jgi:hypothetical protein
MAICLKSEHAVGQAMIKELHHAGLEGVDIKILQADNGGVEVVRYLPKSARLAR